MQRSSTLAANLRKKEEGGLRPVSRTSVGGAAAGGKLHFVLNFQIYP
jgi:hypothetical protein